ncbi:MULTISPECIES: alpha/beta hydrolase [Trichocoleus]|uniref:Alpha/beta hydrolase n=1 Tax=Trichocoleus desertorum GB2-A4 TaxID=2933944 RepID=A0ABV0JFM6_9CYAN|nr:alpha/beta hydrolase [Trichocoleus sp. FACHB-46]MBD1861247.1 alpha/beta hydrolase [Trichocoleus sp. FACHB-46]
MKSKTLKRLVLGEFSVKRFVCSTLLIYAVLCFYAFFLSDRQIFQPQPTSYQDTQTTLKLKTADNVLISAIYLPNPQAQYTILYSHGNAEDLGDIEATLTMIHEAGFAVFAYDYRGYGTSQGQPSEQHAYQDADTAYTYLTQKLKVPANRVIALGRSVGGGVAVDLATRKPLAGLIVESSFVTAFRVVTRVPIVPFDKLANIAKIRRIQCPILIVHGTADEIIPFQHGEQLFQAARSPKQSFWVEDANHDDLVEVAGPRYAQQLQAFAQLVKNSEATSK